ncbi:hypothetical protein EFL83_03500 [Weissella cibaria]|nr:hypothetical protein [Weissella cibaria]
MKKESETKGALDPMITLLDPLIPWSVAYKQRYIKGSAFRNTFKSRQSSDFKSGDWRLLSLRQRLLSQPLLH